MTIRPSVMVHFVPGLHGMGPSDLLTLKSVALHNLLTVLNLYLQYYVTSFWGYWLRRHTQTSINNLTL